MNVLFSNCKSIAGFYNHDKFNWLAMINEYLLLCCVQCTNQAVANEINQKERGRERKRKIGIDDKTYMDIMSRSWYNNLCKFYSLRSHCLKGNRKRVLVITWMTTWWHRCLLIAKIFSDVRIYLRCTHLFYVCMLSITYYTVCNKRLIGVKCCVKRHGKCAFVLILYQGMK